MALLTPTTPAIAGTLAAPGAVSASDTISGNLVGGALKVYNGSGSSINVTFADPGHTAAGNTGTQAASAIANGAARWYPLLASFVNSSTNLITVTFSGTTTVTYELIP